jgi:prophage antirepressor-like protein
VGRKSGTEKLSLSNGGDYFSLNGGKGAAGPGNSLKTKKPQCGNTEASGNEINFGEEIVMGDHSTNVIPFNFGKQQVRTLLIDDQPWFVAADVCASLAIGNVSLAVNGRADRDTDGLDEDEKGIATVNTPSGAQEMLVVNESGLYALIFKSRKAEAKRFKKWITAEVLPTIRKHGRYEDERGQMQPLVQAIIGQYGAQTLSNVIRCRVAKMDAKHQRSAGAKLHSALHARFDVSRIELISGDQMEAACNFVASYAIEGEYLPHEKKSDRLNISFPVEELARRRPGMLIEKAGERPWLDVMLEDLRDIRGEGTPCEEILWELESNGYEVEGALCELKTYRAKLREFQSWVSGMNVLFTEPNRYAVKLEDAA